VSVNQARNFMNYNNRGGINNPLKITIRLTNLEMDMITKLKSAYGFNGCNALFLLELAKKAHSDYMGNGYDRQNQ